MVFRHPTKPMKSLLGMTFSALLLGISSLAMAQGIPQAWGYNFYGALGDGSKTNRNSPVKVAGLNNVVQLAEGQDFSLALKSDGTVWTWGGGNPNAVQIAGLSDVVQVACGHGHGIVLKLDGTVWTWGGNGVGQLGDGTTTTRTNPVQAKNITDVAYVAAGGAHSIVVKLDGTVWTWGWNNSLQLGSGTVALNGGNYSTVPVQALGLTGVVQVAAGFYHSLAIKADGTAWGWGMNGNGQVGDGSTTGRNVPVQVSGLTGARSIAGGAAHSIAVKTDGTAWAWGYNGSGRLGDGTTSQRNSPAQLVGVTGASMAAAGFEHSVVLKSDGTVWCVGNNGSGQLGDGTNKGHVTVVQALGLTGQTNIAGRNAQSLSVPSVPLDVRRKSALSLTPLTVPYAGPITLKTTLTILNTAYPLGLRAVSFKIDGNVVGGGNTTTMGEAAVTLSNNYGVGLHKAEIEFAGDDGFAPSSVSVALTISKANTSLAVSSASGGIGTTKALIAVLSRKSDLAKMANETLTYKIGATVLGTAVTDSNGKASLSYVIPDTFGLGVQTFTVSFAGNAGHKSVQIGKPLTITKAPTLLVQPSVSGKVGATINITATLKRSNGELLSGKTLHFQVDGVAVGDGVTDAAGVATLSYTITAGTTLGKHPMIVSFTEDDLNLSSTRSGASLLAK